MKKTPTIPLLFASSLLIAAGCSTHTVILLPEEDGTTGEVLVSSADGELLVDQPYGVARSTSGFKPSAAGTGKAASVEKAFADVLAAEPEAPETFRLYFDFAQAELTPEARTLLEEIRDRAKARRHVNFAVVGHTDRMGDAAVNANLAQSRAVRVARWLRDTGVPGELIEIDSHGENNPVIPTRDGVAEPKNRRVEITIR